MVEPGNEPGTLWLVVRSSDHQATKLVTKIKLLKTKNMHFFVFIVLIIIQRTVQKTKLFGLSVRFVADEIFLLRSFPVYIQHVH